MIMGVCTVGLSMFATAVVFELNFSRMDKTVKILTEWSKKANLANEVLDDMYRIHKIKESYQQQGIGAEEAKDINKKYKIKI